MRPNQGQGSNMNLSIGRLLAAVLLVSTTIVQAADLRSVYTPVNNARCKAVSGGLAKLYQHRGLGASVCPGVKNWQLLSVSYDPRSWPELARDHTVWQMDEVAHAEPYRFGNFINFDAKQVEWRVAADGVPQALIFRLMAQDESGAQPKTVSRLFVVDLRNGEPKLCGMVKTNKEARALADQPRGCTRLQTQRVK